MTINTFLGTTPLAAAIMARSPALARPAAFRSAADALLETGYPADGPGAAVVVTRGGRVIYSAGRGLADLEGRRPITADTVFRLGSITKQFTAAVVLQLVNEGRISLEDPISRFFPDYPQPGARATVRQLLNHMSGIQDYTKIAGWIGRNRERPHSTAQLIATFRDLPSPAQPGQAWEYNNGGYVMLGAIVEQVTGRPWHEAVTERIARPLGLRTIAYGGSGEAAAAARGHTEEGGHQQPTRPTDMSVPHAAGALVGSARDLARWAQALHHGRVVSPALYQQMVRPGRLADGSTQPYGYGLRLRELRGRPVIVHGGAIAGFATDSVYIPSEDLFIAVLANSDDPVTPPSIVLRRLAALALGQPFPTFSRADVDLGTIDPLLGVYTAQSGPPRRFFSRDGKLYMARGKEETEIFSAGEDRFFFGPEELTWLRLVRQADGAHVMEVHRPEAAEPERAVHSGPVPAGAPLVVAPATLRSYVGTYSIGGPVFTIAAGEGGRLTVQVGGAPALPMRPIAENEFMVDQARSRIVFHNENGQVNRLTVHRGARQVEGRRVAP